MPFYVSPEQIIKDKADYARKGIARGRSVVVVQYTDGIVFVAENPSRALHKVSEIYDRIAFAAVGKYNEFENLRVAGVRLADMRGYSYDRRDVTGRGLANAYAQTLGTIFTETNKPYEVEIVVAEVGERAEDDQMYRLTFDGSVADDHGFVAMGGQADQITTALTDRYVDGMDLARAVALGVDVLGRHGSSEARVLDSAQLETAVLDRTRTGNRKFRRLTGERLTALLAESGLQATAEPHGEDKGDDRGTKGARAAKGTKGPKGAEGDHKGAEGDHESADKGDRGTPDEDA
jgi:proteasome alpha subunit